MHKLVTKEVQVMEQVSEGFYEPLLGKQVLIFGAVYNWHGKLIAVNDKGVILSNTSLVFETGSFTNKKFTDAQSLPCSEFRVAYGMIQGIGEWNQ